MWSCPSDASVSNKQTKNLLNAGNFLLSEMKSNDIQPFTPFSLRFGDTEMFVNIENGKQLINFLDMQIMEQTLIYDGDSATNGGKNVFIENIPRTCSGKSSEKMKYADEPYRIKYPTQSVDSLIRDLFPTSNYCPDRNYVFTVLLNIRIYISPLDLLRHLSDHCMLEAQIGIENDKMSRNIMHLLFEWSEAFPYDFCVKDCMDLLKMIMKFCCSINSDLRLLSVKLIQNLNGKLSKLQRYEKALYSLNMNTGLLLCGPTENTTSIIDTFYNPTVFAQQLAHIELERLSMIGSEEFVYAFSKNILLDLMHPCNRQDMIHMECRAFNIKHYAEWCNRLRLLVGTEICRHIKKKNRAKALEFFVDVAQECFNMGNFNSLFVIAGTIDSNAVKRLKKTWLKMNNASKWKILEHQTDPGCNFSNYRATLKAANWRSKDRSSKNRDGKIVIPAFAVLHRDLLALHEYSKSPKMDCQNLNVKAFTEFSEQMEEFSNWKEAECSFETNHLLLQYILTVPIYDEQLLEFASYQCEPPTNIKEKDACKKLRMEIQCSYSNRGCEDSCGSSST
uniref:Ras-GEF domain-containing protein n=1 Tax=Romanomermis culicivorax TaxID=13658 RepID=A0A915J7F9_ROMCU